MRKKLLGASLLVILLSVAAYGTWAYFTTEARITNVITTGTIDITLNETTTGGVAFPKKGISGVMPGQSVDKLVTVENEGDSPAWIRVGVFSQIEAADGSELPLSLGDAGDVLSFDINTEHWTDGEDGYFYYLSPVQAGETTEQLFSKVTFNAAMTNDYQNCTAYVDVAAQAVQIKHNGSSALEAEGWPALESDAPVDPVE